MQKIYPLLALLTISLTACAGPVTMSPQGSGFEIQQEAQREKELAFKKQVEDRDHIFNVAFPILVANADACGRKTAPSVGMTAWNLASITRSYQQAAINLYNLQERLAVQSVADKSPADKAGIRSGDFIVAINSQNVPAGQNALKAADHLLQASGYNPADILLERSGKLVNAVVQPVTACDYPVLLDYNSADLNAFTDGRRIVVSKGIVRFVENDNELALVIAHELGHLAMGHIDKKQQNALAGAIGGLALDSLMAAAGVSSGNQFSQLGQHLGAQSYSVAFEQEADYVGMYFMERAGYHSGNVAHFWRRLAAEMPRSVSIRTDHPTSPERFIAIEHTHQEIIRKKTGGQTLAPNLQLK